MALLASQTHICYRGSVYLLRHSPGLENFLLTREDEPESNGSVVFPATRFLWPHMAAAVLKYILRACAFAVPNGYPFKGAGLIVPAKANVVRTL
jgi:hypothetical protein